jgi:two-component system, NarL family, response regulator DesR
MSAKIRIMLAEDEHLIRSALVALLALEDDLTVVAQAATGAEAVSRAHTSRPDVALLDLQLPDRDGIAVARTLHKELPDCRTIILTSHGRPGHLKRALATNVRGFLPKAVPAAALADAVRTVHSGGRYIDSELAAEAIRAGDNPLTPREALVLTLAADGAPVDQIARGAALSAGTVRNYLSTAGAKLGATNRHDAVRIARRHGWI